jgi:glycosyltransferase involved in cell wall biosynthesis
LRILLVIDSFGSGGAQRQIINLAIVLKKRGHQVEIFNYFPHLDFYRSALQEEGIVIHDFVKKNKFSILPIFALIKLLMNGDFDVALSYLATPNLYLEIAHLFSWETKIIVSERSSHLGSGSITLQKIFHSLATRVVVNSKSHQAWLLQKYPAFKTKLSVIYNGVDFESFQLADPKQKRKNKLRFLAIGRVGPEKNILNVVHALFQFHQKYGWCPHLDWVGDFDGSDDGKKYFNKVSQFLGENTVVKEKITFMGPRYDVNLLIKEYDALLHPSLYEGLPNVICESLAVGRPVLASNVCDNGILVEDGKRGFLFNPTDSSSIVSAINRFNNVEQSYYLEMCQNSRGFAEKFLSLEQMVNAYEALFLKICNRYLA